MPMVGWPDGTFHARSPTKGPLTRRARRNMLCAFEAVGQWRRYKRNNLFSRGWWWIWFVAFLPHVLSVFTIHHVLYLFATSMNHRRGFFWGSTVIKQTGVYRALPPSGCFGHYSENTSDCCQCVRLFAAFWASIPARPSLI